MKYIVLTILVLTYSGAIAIDESQRSRLPTTKAANEPIVYIPIDRDVPTSRTSGASRGNDSTLELAVIAPDQTAHTASPRPVLYWYANQATTKMIEITLVGDRQAEPVVEVKLDGIARPGIHAFKIPAEVGDLEVAVAYRWSVAGVSDQARPSSDIVATALFIVADGHDKVAARDDSNFERQRAIELASEGYWYDTYHVISELIRENPNDRGLLADREQLHQQANLAIDVN